MAGKQKGAALILIEQIEPEDFTFRTTADEKAEVVANCDHLKRLRFSPSLPDDFMFRLTREEWGILRSQTATSNLASGLRSQFVTLSAEPPPPPPRGGRHRE